MATPVILDTDIGLDVDDVWALAFALTCPEIDLQLVVSDTGNTRYNAAVAAKVLTEMGRSDIPVGIGIPFDDLPQTHAGWLGDFALDDYKGTVHTDGVGALCEFVRNSPEPVTVVAIGPVPNLAAALQRDPDALANARFVGMHGSLRTGYMGAPDPAREYNVANHVEACQAVFSAPWDMTITPLDSCGRVILKGDHFEALQQSRSPAASVALANHFSWFEAVREWPQYQRLKGAVQSSVLFDTVAVYLAFADELLEMETLPVRVTDDGMTVIDEGVGKPMRCATGWRDYAAFEHLLVERLTRMG